MKSHSSSKTSEGSVLDLKLFSVLKVFNVYELNRFGKFIRSAYFNKNENLIKLFETLEHIIKTDSKGILTKGEAWSSVITATPYNDIKFRKLCSDLLRLIEQFLVQEEFDKNPLHKADYLLQAITEKKLNLLTKSSLRTAQRLSEQYYFRPASYYYYQYAFERSIHSMKDQEIDRSKIINVEEIAAHLDTFFIAEKLRYYCLSLVQKHMVDHQYDFLFLEEIIRQVEENKFYEVTPINFYYQFYLTQKYPNVNEHYLKLKLLIREQIDELPSIEAKEIMVSAFNFCIQKINTGHDEYIREIFELYKESIRNEHIFVNGMLDAWNFRNVIVSGLRLGEYTWVEEFIHNYQDRLDIKYRSNAVNFNLANLYFYQKRYDRVMELLQEVEYEDPSYNLNSKSMLIATYYELDEVEPLMSLLTSFSVYLRREKKLPAARKGLYQNLIKYVRLLVRTPLHDKAFLTKLKDEINQHDGIVNKAWLIEKIEEFL